MIRFYTQREGVALTNDVIVFYDLATSQLFFAVADKPRNAFM